MWRPLKPSNLPRGEFLRADPKGACYLVEVVAKGERLIAAELAGLPDNDTTRLLVERLAAIGEGQRDLYF